jgi:hypothetical protein
MAVKPTEEGGTFNAAAAQAKRQQMVSTRAQEVVATSTTNKPPVVKSETVATGFTNDAVTQEKILVLAAKNKNVGDYLGSLLLGTKQTTPSSTAASVPTTKAAPTETSVENKPIDRYTKNVLQTIFSAEVNAINTQSSQADAVINKPESKPPPPGEANHGTSGLKEDLNKLLQPISSFTGSTLGALPNLLNNPTGSAMALAGSMASMVDKVNPELMNKLDSAFKMLKTSELSHLPGQIMGSIRSLVTAANKMLAGPISLLSDLYGGLMKITQQISKLVDRILSMVQNFFFGPQGILDQVIPSSLVKTVMSAIGEIGAAAGQLSQLAGGFSAVTNITSQLTNFSSQGAALLSNPMSLASSYVPQLKGLSSSLGGGGAGGFSRVAGQATGGLGGGQIGTAVAALRDPSQLISKLIPAQLSSQLGKINQIPGMGSVGNLGYGLSSVLEPLKQKVTSQTLSQFSAQAGILGPMLNAQGPPPLHSPSEPREVAIGIASVNPAIQVVHGVPVQRTPAPSII